MQYQFILGGCLALSCLCGCPGYSSDGTPNVSYSVSCGDVSCPGADDRSTYTSGNNSAITCVWDCADYDGQYGVYVSLDFWAWDGGCYELESEYVSSGICDYSF